MNEQDVQKLVHNEYAQTSIRVKARQLCRRADFDQSEREDIEQELWLHLLTQAKRFDPERSSLRTFIDRMVNSAAALLVRHREYESRADGFHLQSLDAFVPAEGGQPKSLRSSLTPEDGARRTFTSPPQSDLDVIENHEALYAALATMPEPLRALCRRLMEGASPTALARELGISRRRVRRLVDEAGGYLRRAGLEVE